MSVVVWDGATLAADRLMVIGDLKQPGTKIQLIGGNLHAYNGDLANARRLSVWYENGADPAAFPELSDEDFARLIVFSAKKRIVVFEGRAVPEPWDWESRIAWGGGRDFAMGALHMGADAIRAVEAANDLCATCGAGVEAWRVMRGKWQCVSR